MAIVYDISRKSAPYDTEKNAKKHPRDKITSLVKSFEDKMVLLARSEEGDIENSILLVPSKNHDQIFGVCSDDISKEKAIKLASQFATQISEPK